MRTTCGSAALAAVFLLMEPVPLKAAEIVHLLSMDDRGVTLRLDPPAYRLEGGPEGRSLLSVPGFQAMDVPGRPAMPFMTVLVALPPGATAVVTLLEAGAEEERTGVRLAIGGRPVFRTHGSLECIPAREPVPAILDGPWPGSPVEVGEPFIWQRQRLVAVSLRPLRYDEATQRLWARPGMTVRGDFVGGAPPGIGLPAAAGSVEPVIEAEE